MNAPARLRPDLADTDFERLFAAARAAIPKYAPLWTDHNTHDPGIMLLELAAFVADAQIYSLARLRRDERAAYAALFGVRPRGPLPAYGMIRPYAAVEACQAQLLAQGLGLECELRGAPPFRLCERINLSTLRLTRIATQHADDVLEVHDDTNLRAGAAWYPFGRSASASAQLWLDLRGVLFNPSQALLPPAQRGYLALGVEVPPNPDAPVFEPDEIGTWCDASTIGGALSSAAGASQDSNAPHMICPCSPLTARMQIGVVDYALPIVRDDSAGMRRSGVILFDLAAVPANASGTMRIVLHSATGRHNSAAQVLRLDLNCLPVEQIHRFKLPVELYFGTNLPDQSYRFDVQDCMYAETANGLQTSLSVKTTVKDTDTEWQACLDLSHAVPGETVYALDLEAHLLRFGNGINGACPPAGASLKLEYDACAGRTGNLARGFRWALPEAGGAWFGSNPLPMCGGDDAMDDARARRIARAKVRHAHACVTDADLATAALDHPQLQVVRAQMLPSTSAMVRTLLAVFVGEAEQSTSQTADFARPRAALQAALQARCLLGTVLQVRSAQFVEVAVEAELRISAELDPAEVEAACEAVLSAWLAVVPTENVANNAANNALWPIGRALTILDLKAQLRGVLGVRAVPQCRWIVNGKVSQDSQVKLASDGLPRYQSRLNSLTFKVNP